MADERETGGVPEPLRRIFDRWRQQREGGLVHEVPPEPPQRSMRRLLAGAGVPSDAIDALKIGIQTDAMKAAEDFLVAEASERRVLGLFGARGVGKTVAACHALGQLIREVEAIPRAGGAELRAPGHFVTATEFSRALGAPQMREWFERLNRCHALVLDDIGKEPLSGYRADEFKAALFELVSTRHAAHRRTMLTSNLSKPDFGRRYGANLADRLRDRCLCVELTGPSLRGKPVTTKP